MSTINMIRVEILKHTFLLNSLKLLKSWLSNPKMPFYAVANGRSKGIFMTWADCEAQVKGFSAAKYKKFDSVEKAQEFININSGGTKFTALPPPKQSHISHVSNSLDSKPKLKRPYSKLSPSPSQSSINTNQQNKELSKKTTNSDESFDDFEGLDTVLNKQMDDIEKRLKSFAKGVDKIVSKGRRTQLIEPVERKRARKSDNELEKDDQGYVQVYTDGACSANGRKGARAGIGVYWGEDHHLNVSEPVSGRATNNCGEIQAATRAIKQALDNGIGKLTINTDSQFLINSVTKWIPGWKRKGWKLASGEPVKNEADFKDLDSVQRKIDIKWNYVKAHKGVHGNERADELAKAGAAQYGKR